MYDALGHGRLEPVVLRLLIWAPRILRSFQAGVDTVPSLRSDQGEEGFMTPAQPVGRRTVLTSAAAGVAAGGALLATSSATAEAQAQDGSGSAARESFTVVDRRGRQRFLVDTRKPPIIIGGKTHPPSMRSGPENATYLLFNDDNGEERGGLLATADGAHLAFDYPNAVDGVSLGIGWAGNTGGAGLELRGMPIAGSGPDVRAVPRARLGCHTSAGALLQLCDSQGRPRIVLQVDSHDNPSITLLDENGRTTMQLPSTG
ncbi:MAG: hypothetical protein H0W01_16460 [Pseudonocardiales bacterium]|nr:hypothetical protein [Pseudonocardiales bacterium]